MNRGTAMLLAPHATRLHALMASTPPYHLAGIAVIVLIVVVLLTVAARNPRRSR